MNFSKRSYTKELLDADNIPFADIERNMKEIDNINRLLGGHDITLHGFKKIIQDKKKISVCEIGCGNGNNLKVLLAYCLKHNIDISLAGIDIKKECIDAAMQDTSFASNAKWFVSDYAKVLFDEKPDIIFSSLFCHHFADEALIYQLKWMYDNCTTGFFINDLQRYPLAYHSIKILTKLFSSSYLVKNDAPLSVARGFVKDEWEGLLDNAGIKNYSVEWKWAFRYLITCRK